MGTHRNKAIEVLKDLNIPLITAEFDITPILNYDDTRLAELDIYTVREYMSKLSTYLIYVQQQYNAAKVDLADAEREFKEAITKNMDLVSGKTKEERRINAEYLEEVQQEREKLAECQAIVIMLEDIPKAITEKLNVLKRIHDDLQDEKRASGRL